jgi:hypothetical protein
MIPPHRFRHWHRAQRVGCLTVIEPELSGHLDKWGQDYPTAATRSMESGVPFGHGDAHEQRGSLQSTDGSMTSTDGLPVASDSVFQRQLRARQSRRREAHELPIGEHNGRPLGSRLAMSFARDELANYLTPTIRRVVSDEVLGPDRDHSKLYSAPRIFDDLLSSQPLCFNLFGELKEDLTTATAFARRIWPTGSRRSPPSSSNGHRAAATTPTSTIGPHSTSRC